MIENEKSSIRYTCDGTTNNFEVPFKFFKNIDGAPVIYQLAVYHQIAGEFGCTLLVENVDYEVIWDEATSTGSITTFDTYNLNDRIAILRRVIDTQEVDFDKNKPFPYEGTEKALDKITMSLQEVKDRITRTVQLPETSEDSPTSVLERIYTSERNAAQSAIEAAMSATEADNTKDIVYSYIENAEESERIAGEQAMVAEGFKNEALRVLGEINQVVEKIKNLGKNWLVYSSGESRADIGYEGSLTNFPIPELVEHLTTQVYLDGVWKEPVEEFLVEEGQVVFPFEVPFGTRVVIIWQDAKERPLYAHNYLNTSHPYLLQRINELEASLGMVIGVPKVEEIATAKIGAHNEDMNAHPYLLSQLNLKADKSKTYPVLNELKQAVEDLKESMVESSELEDYYKKTGGTIEGSVKVRSSSDYIIDLVRTDKDNHLKVSIDNEGTILILNTDADGAHGLELRKDGSLYLRKRIAGLNGYRTFKVLTEEDL